MKKTKTENRDVEDLESVHSKATEVFHSDAFDDFIQEEIRLKDSEVLLPREIAPKPTLTLTLDKNSPLNSKQLQNPQVGNSHKSFRRNQKERNHSLRSPTL